MPPLDNTDLVPGGLYAAGHLTPVNLGRLTPVDLSTTDRAGDTFVVRFSCLHLNDLPDGSLVEEIRSDCGRYVWSITPPVPTKITFNGKATLWFEHPA